MTQMQVNFKQRGRKFNMMRIVGIVLIVLMLLALFVFWQNNGIVTTVINYSNPKIEESFDGYTIVQVSDLHNKSFGKNQSTLLKKIKKKNPDMIVVTGDLVDSRSTNIAIAMQFIEGAMKLAPVYYVTGNHESREGILPELKNKLEVAGVMMMDDNEMQIEKNGDVIELIGLSDPAFSGGSNLENNNPLNLEERLNKLSANKQQAFTILLSHRPELFDVYVDHKIDLVFSGHAHGGQFRIPFVGGLIAPGQGFFPKYTSGSHTVDETTMIVSRGLGNSVVPLRLFNRPELIVVTLQNE
ncbi:metallophosphoesterase [Paenibacillus yanchengensis]|uniref:Metallophosphoesterase n=1 Tax=Paenibacillus yanchengensis TaxID=2035833 RepID=A0ABW4YML6_9BACL